MANQQVNENNNKHYAKELVKLTGCDYHHVLQNLNSGASFKELYDFYYDDCSPSDNLQNF